MEDKIDLEKISQLENCCQYIANMRPVFNRRALYSDTTENYISPEEPAPNDKVTIRFRTAKNNVDRVVLVTRDEKYAMSKVESDKHFDYYAQVIQPGRKRCLITLRYRPED